MRFHIGFSKRISFKWVILILGGFLAFFGIDKAFALTMSADATATYVLSPYGAKEFCSGGNCVNYPSGNLINEQSGTPYNTTWSSQRYSAFKTITSPYTALGYRDDIFGARLRWTYATADMNKCSNKSITYTFQFFLRNIASGSLPQLWDTNGLYKKVWIRSSQQNYDCTIKDKDGHILTAECTIPNPTAVVYVYLEDFTIPHLSVIDDGYYNVGLAPIEYKCVENGSAEIIANQNANTQDIINNQNNNTEQITQAIENSTSATTSLNDTLIDNTVPSVDELPQFVIENMAISSQTQQLFMLPIQLLNAVLSGATTECIPLRIDVSSIARLGSHNGTIANGTYLITIPCLGTKVSQLLGSWYDVFDSIMACIVFYYVGTNIVMRIQQLFSGVDTLPSYYSSHGKTKTLLVDNSTGEVVG